jgi:sterol desaturase/sphingolipid hydroxylase (fatty acid hydroxylase superfamily)
MSSLTVTGETAAAAPRSRRARTLGEAFAIFASHLSPALIMISTLVLVVARLVVGDWHWRQLVIVGVLFALQPFIEWTTHVWILHARPRRLLGREIDLYVAKKHRRHHADPRNLEILSMPVPGLVTFSLATTGAASLLGSWADRLTLAVTVAVFMLVYEWTHFLIHTDYKPKTAAYRKLYQHHRLHHFRNENYWFGVARRFGDQVLGTNPSKNDVPLSPTCKAILG